MNVSALERKYLGRAEESQGLVVARSRPSHIFDSRRRKYIDFMMGWCVGNLGWHNATTRARIRKFRGSEAVDMALQAAMVHTGRKKFLSIEDSYHGNTLAGLSVASSDNRKKYPSLLPDCHKIDAPLDADALDKVETRRRSPVDVPGWAR